MPNAVGYVLMFVLYLSFAARISFKPGTMAARVAGVLLVASFLEFMVYAVIERS
jgi:uncharacterized membrane protein (DUF485 family)